MNNTLIVGGGPIGLNLAARIASEGWQADVLEEHPQIGKPVHCSGLISASGCEELNLNVSDILLNEIKGARIYSPENKVIEVRRKKTVANLVDRALFDKMFYEKAKKAGAKIHLRSKLINVKNNTVFFQKKKRGEIKKAQYVVGADGVQSKIRDLMGINIDKNLFVHAYQEHVEGYFEKDMVEVHFGKFAPGYFGWIIPKNESTAEVGLAVTLGSMNPAEAFKKFVEEKKLGIKTVSKDSALIPCGPPLKTIMENNMFLVGDAGFQTKATSGGGLMLGLQSSNVLADTILNNIKSKTSLDKYALNMNKINKELMMHWKIYSYYQSLSEKALNKLFVQAQNAGIEQFLEEFGDMDKPSRFIGKILKKPKMWSLVPMALKILR